MQRAALAEEDSALLAGLSQNHRLALEHLAIFLSEHGHGGLRGWLDLVRHDRGHEAQRLASTQIERLVSTPLAAERLRQALNVLQERHIEAGRHIDIPIPRTVGQAVFQGRQARGPVPEVPAAQRLSPAGALQWFRTRVQDHDLIEHVYGLCCALADQATGTTRRHRGTLYELASHLAEAHAEDAEAPDGLMQFLSHREGVDPGRRAKAQDSLDAFARQHPKAGSRKAIEEMVETFSSIPEEDRLETSRRHEQDTGGFNPARMRWLLPPQDRALLTGLPDYEASRLLRFSLWLLRGGRGGLTEWLSMPAEGGRDSLLREYRRNHSERYDANLADIRALCRAAGVSDDVGGGDLQPPGRPEAGEPAPAEPDANVEGFPDERVKADGTARERLRPQPQRRSNADEIHPRLTGPTATSTSSLPAAAQAAGRPPSGNPRSGMRTALPIDDRGMLAPLPNADAIRLVHFASRLMHDGHGGLKAWLDLIRGGEGPRARDLALHHVRQYPKQSAQIKGLAAVIRRLQEHAGIDPSRRIELLDPKPVRVAPGGAPRGRQIPVNPEPRPPELRQQDQALLAGFARTAVWVLSRFAIALSEQGGLSGWLDMLRRGQGREAQQLASTQMERLASTPSTSARLRQALHRLQAQQGIEAERRIEIPIPKAVEQVLLQARRARPAPGAAGPLRLTPAGAVQWFRTRMQDHDLIEHAYAPFCTLVGRAVVIKDGRTALYRLASHIAAAHAEDAAAPDGLAQFLSDYEGADSTRRAQAQASLGRYMQQNPETGARHDIEEALGTLSSIPEEDRLEASRRDGQEVRDLNPRRARWLLPPQDAALLAGLPMYRATRLLWFDLWLLQGGHGGLTECLSDHVYSLVDRYQAQHRLGKDALFPADLEALREVAGRAGDTAASTLQTAEGEAGWSAPDELDLVIALYLDDLDLDSALGAIDPGDSGQADQESEQIAEPPRLEAVAVDATASDPLLDESWLDDYPVDESLNESLLDEYAARELLQREPVRRSNTEEMLRQLSAQPGAEGSSGPSVDSTAADQPPAPDVERLLQAMSRLRVAARAGHSESIAMAARAVQLEPSRLAEFLGQDGRLRGTERVQTWLLGLSEAQREAVLRFQHDG